MEVEADELGSFSCVTLCLHVSDTNIICFPDCLLVIITPVFHFMTFLSSHNSITLSDALTHRRAAFHAK